MNQPADLGAWRLPAAGLLLCLSAGVAAQRFPEPNPPLSPYVEGRFKAPAAAAVQAPSAAPTTEWTYHRNDNGRQPSAAEQYMLWLMNRARRDPTAEGIWLATSTDPDIKGGRDYFKVDTKALKEAFAALPARAPAAFDIRLHDASAAHSRALIARDSQDHDGQDTKVENSGFQCNGYRLSVFSYADSALNAHGALNIDWGNGPGGMQDPPGHRYAIMGELDFGSGNISLSNVGLALVPENDPATTVGPLVFSGAYCHADSPDHNRFIVGTVYDDKDEDGEYDPGEGLGGVTVMPDSGTYYAVTGDAGGYAIPITSQGSYQVTFSGGDLGGATIKKPVSVGAESALLDVVLSTDDTDNDGVVDGVDNCPSTANADQTDTDGDGLGDACDDDKDGDGVANADDDFPLDPNETTDTDGDGVGDNADAFPNDPGETTDTDGDGTGNNADPDDDNDGVADVDDDFPLDASETTDTDGDGTGDNADTDDDNDGMPDAYEDDQGFDRLVAADAGQDADDDGFTNLREFRAGSDPHDPDSVPKGSTSWLPLLFPD